MRRRIILALASSLGLGFIPFMPGTFGTLGGVALILPLARMTSQAALLFALIGIFLLAVYLADEARVYLGGDDPQPIVIDEVLGYLVTLFAVTPTWPHLIEGFVLFRIFDILKPAPAKWFDSRHGWGGFAIVLDDVAAGFYANIVLRIIVSFYG